MSKRKAVSKSPEIDFPFYRELQRVYLQNKLKIRRKFDTLSKKFLDYNENNGFLRKPQFEALEMYIFLKEFLNNASVADIFFEWKKGAGNFTGLELHGEDLFEMVDEKSYSKAYEQLKIERIMLIHQTTVVNRIHEIS